MFTHKFKSEIQEIHGVHRITIETPFPVGPVSVYLYKIDDSYVMYDAGLDMGNWKKVFLSALNEIKISLKDIDYCFVSHEHTDHIGLIRSLKKENPNIKIMMSEITYKTLAWESNPENQEKLEELAWDNAKLMIKYGMKEERARELVEWSKLWAKIRKGQKPDRLLHDGDEIEFPTNKLKMIWTPGHSLGHICMFDVGNKFLFSGDHILSRITPHIGNFIVNPEIDEKHNFDDILKHYLQSLDRIDSLHPKIIFPGHQEVIYDPSVRINEIKLHHVNRLREMMKVIKNRPLTPMRISKLHFGRGLDQLNSMLALSEVLGHLIYLENLNKVRRVEKNNKILFVS
ncbi:MAG: MBL fold metallo-hydrolase [Promethearchaeota archaeon]